MADADPKLIRHLKHQPLFKSTPEAILAQIANKIEQRSLPQGGILFHEGDPSSSLFIIRSGWVKAVSLNHNEEEVTLNQYGPGQIIGEISLIDNQPRENTIIALRPLDVMEIKYDDVLQLLDEHPVMARSLLQEMVSRVRFANAYIEETMEWFRQIASGNYDFVEDQLEESQSTIIDLAQSHEARAGAFLSAFFKMIKGVRKREEDLKQQVQQLTIEIDKVKQQQTVGELTGTEFFQELKAAAQKLRDERDAKHQDPSSPSDSIDG